jgi:hypothetical protein
MMPDFAHLAAHLLPELGLAADMAPAAVCASAEVNAALLDTLQVGGCHRDCCLCGHCCWRLSVE